MYMNELQSNTLTKIKYLKNFKTILKLSFCVIILGLLCNLFRKVFYKPNRYDIFAKQKNLSNHLMKSDSSYSIKSNDSRLESNPKNMDYEYIIIGSGPAGLQTAYYLQKHNKKYVILEKSDEVGSFFKKYPIHRNLISINKVNTGTNNKEFNLRHDWNSLLSDDDSLLFKNYTKDFYPKADVMVKYLNDYYKKNKLNVIFNTDVYKINRIESNNLFQISTNKSNFKCKKLIMAAGLFKPHKMKIAGAIPYSELTTDKKKFLNKNVLIIGQGNSGFETADHLIDTAAVIHIAGKGPLKFAWQTHYVGHLRAVNNNFLDTYLLKSQNGLTGLDDDEIVVRKNGKFFIYDTSDKTYDNQGPPEGYDYVIDCTGFEIDTSIFSNIKPDHNGKVPLLKSNFESQNIKNLFFAGVLSQHIAYKKSSGAFIHGFRYLIRSMIDIETNSYRKTTINNKNELINKILDRINNGSGIFQMFGCLADFVIIYQNKFIYIEEIPIKYIKSNFLNKYDSILIITLDYGDFGGVIENSRDLGNASYVFGEDRVTGAEPKNAHLSNFIHPVFRLYTNNKFKKEFHLSEHLMTQYKLKDIHIKPLTNFISKLN